MTSVGVFQLAKSTLARGQSRLLGLVVISGVGIVVGSLPATAGGSFEHLKRRYLLGLLAMAGGILAAGLAPLFAAAAAAFAVIGFGNGLAAAHEQLLVQRSAPEQALGRVFGVKGMLISGAFGLSFLLGGAFASLFGPRVLFLVAGAGLLCAWAWSAYRPAQPLERAAGARGGARAGRRHRFGLGQRAERRQGALHAHASALAARAWPGRPRARPRPSGQNWVPAWADLRRATSCESARR